MNDSELIDSLGGPAKLAELLGYEKEGGTQRVHNWRTRGIPSDVKVKWPQLFMPDLFVSRAPPAGSVGSNRKAA